MDETTQRVCESTVYADDQELYYGPHCQRLKKHQAAI